MAFFQPVQSILVIAAMREIIKNTAIFLSPMLHLLLVQRQVSIPFLMIQETCPPLMSW